MNANLIERLPDWYRDINPDNHYLVMTDDFDSFYSCQKLNSLFGVNVGGFYSFDKGLYLCDSVTDGKEPIYVDLSISQGKCFDNHFTFINNQDAINPNIIRRKYYEKYNGGTIALILSLYDCMDEQPIENIVTMLCIDSFYLGYYRSNGRYRDVNLFWFEQLGITDYVLPVLESHTSDYFERFTAEAQLAEKIFIDDGGLLNCAVDLQLPRYRYELTQPTIKRFVSKSRAISIYNADRARILVSNEAYKEKYVLNLKAS